MRGASAAKATLVSNARGLLVIVPCGKAKVWDKRPDAGPTAACDAYVGAPFRVNRKYAERFGDVWVILSAKYGFVRPNEAIPEPYDVTFKRRASHPVGVGTLRRQVRERGLDRFDEVVGLGGKEYRAAIEGAFAGSAVRLRFPFAGLALGPSMSATKGATEREAGS